MGINNMVIKESIIFMLFAYWLLSIFLIYTKKNSLSFILKFRKLKTKIFLLIVIIFMSSCLFWNFSYSIESLLIKIVFKFSAIILDIAGTMTFIYYCYKEKGVTFVFPILLLIHGTLGAEKFLKNKFSEEK